MSKRFILIGLSAFLAWAGAASAARARVIDTFSFSNSSGWSTAGTLFSGSFTGTVEPDALIEMSDLTSFQISGVGFSLPFGDAIKSDLTLFSYNTKGGASSLAFIWSQSLAITVCSGAPSVLSLACNPGGNNPPTTVADIIIGAPLITVTPDLTTVTLVSSVTVPEPSTWVMMLLGFAGVGFSGYGAIRKRRAAIAAA